MCCRLGAPPVQRTLDPYLMHRRLVPEACIWLCPLAYVMCHKPRGSTGTPHERGARTKSYWAHDNLGPPPPEDSAVTCGDLVLIRSSLDTWQHQTSPNWRVWMAHVWVRDRPAGVRPLTVICRVPPYLGTRGAFGPSLAGDLEGLCEGSIPWLKSQDNL